MKQRKKWLLMLVFSFVAAIVLAACGGNTETEGDPSDDGAGTDDTDNTEEVVGEAAEGGELIFVTPSDAPTLDPHGVNDTASNTATSQMLERLTDYNEDGEVIPLLAESFEPINDLTWEFKLREGIKFHDGTDFNAEAVKVSLERILDEEFASPKRVILAMISEVEVIDDYTVQISTEEPFAALPAHLAHNAGSIIAPSAIEEENNGGKTVDENPIGTGPFELDSWNRGAEILMVKNENYWGEGPYLDSIKFISVPEQATRVAMLESGEAHIMLVGASDVNRVEAMSQIEIDRVSGTRMDYVGINLEKEPFDDKLVRQAVAMAINKDDVVDGILDGQGVPAVGPLAPTVVGNHQDLVPLPYDVEGAKELLAEAGYADGFSTTIFVNDGSKERADIAEFVQTQLAEIGITVDIEVIEWGAFLEKTAAGEHELFVLGWTTVTGDADYGLYNLFHSSQFGDPGNRSFYSNSRVDELLDLGRTSTDQDERNQAYKEVSEILVDEVPMIYLHHPDFVHGMNGVSSGLFVNFSGTPFFKDVQLAQ
ncbi:ABC transporter substrate-binding protein [Alkalihalobacillus alcalophilus ATCC 27647 = CGMCC 1.3604]|uniref:ABC transporter substrate-binding protein n=1 Tax=Alkalihalobacillus alcalophilus ATCC 27647 = CGMCC 1.3604 TaxID=1218173 RepID=A0A094YSZ1_ALKAL|nr:glutathione ABC transporter substrate-binding protein [Alkalihalobacillus alcalophilus]KGA96607.1 ABC transporter substrate-binding protein [Alkalihalobacillus alcalophilus ATCC 27647 = CGMCC 1.3604]MED1561702.1 glutathione ABC transporter substrate-binding protein [Alkalihalobacillus alcalophilus]THG92254.1 ABC transporter substrate-binding protein [Alkalihalobacillus alcalophilus ATCC 27647 = CGMCC 1.3604]